MQPLHGDRAHVDEDEIVAPGRDQDAPVEEAVARVGAQDDDVVVDQRGEDRRAVGLEAEQGDLAGLAERVDLRKRKERLEPVGVLAQDRRVAADDERAGVGPPLQLGEESLIFAAVRDPVERIGGEPEEAGAVGRFEKSLIHALIAPFTARKGGRAGQKTA